MIKTFSISVSGDEIAYSGSMTPGEALMVLGQILVDYGKKTANQGDPGEERDDVNNGDMDNDG